MKKIFVMGAAAMDTIVKVKEFPQLDSIAAPLEVVRTPGGSTANVAVGLARMGNSPEFLGCCGDDPDGALLKASFIEECVGIGGLLSDPQWRTPGAFIAVNAEGERVMYSLGGDALYTDPVQLDKAALSTASALYIGEAFSSVAAEAADAVHSAGGKVFFGPGGVMCSFGLEELAPTIACCDVLFLSHSELTQLTSAPIDEGAAQLLSMGAKVVVVTDGSRGAHHYTARQHTSVAALKVNAVDTTGAGDAFTSAFIHSELSGADAQSSLQFACKAAAYAITKIGGRCSPTIDQITNWRIQ